MTDLARAAAGAMGHALVPRFDTNWACLPWMIEFAQIQGYRVALFEERTGGDDATIADPKWTVELRPRYEETVIVRESDVHPLPAMCRAVVALRRAITPPAPGSSPRTGSPPPPPGARP